MAEIASTYIIANGLTDMAYLLYDLIRAPSIHRYVFDRKLKPAQREEKYKKRVAEEDRRLAHLIRGVRYVIHIAESMYGLYIYTDLIRTMRERDINPFGLNFQEGSRACGLSEGFWHMCRPITSPLYFLIHCTSLLYHLNELRHFMDPSFPDRGEIPAFEITIGEVRAHLSSKMASAYDGHLD